MKTLSRALLLAVSVMILSACLSSALAAEYETVPAISTQGDGSTVWTICRDDWYIVLTRIDYDNGGPSTFGGACMGCDGVLYCAWNYAPDGEPYTGMSYVNSAPGVWLDSADEPIVYVMPGSEYYFDYAEDCNPDAWAVPHNIALCMDRVEF